MEETTTSRSGGPLAGLRVIDFTRYLAGPFATMMLADLGAEVIKIETPETGDPSRLNPPFVGDLSSYFLSVNRGKKSVTLDLKRPEGAALAVAIAEHCDVLVENGIPGAMARLGLDYPTLAVRHPRLIYASCSGFGQTGPRAGEGAFDMVVQGMAGTLSITGEENRPPVRVGYSIGDLGAALFTAFGILAALHERDRGGRGQYLDVSMLEAQMALLENAFARYFAAGEVPGRIGSRHPLITPFQVFPTSDGYVILAAGNDKQWRAFCQVVDRPDLPEDPRFQTVRDRTAHHQDLEPILSEIFGQRPSGEWISRLTAAGVPCSPINDVAAAANDPQVVFREIIRTLTDPVAGSVRVIDTPLHFSRTPGGAAATAPRLGQHTEEVLRELAGVTSARFSALQAQGIV